MSVLYLGLKRALWAALLVGVALVGEAWAESGTLKTVSKPVLWGSSVARGIGHVGEVPECANGCDRFDLHMSLPNGAWNQKAGGVQVAIRWQAASIGDNLKLFVYRGSTLIAKSDGIIATKYLEVSGVPDGDYVLETQADPDGLLHEVTRANDCTSVRIRLRDMSTSSPSVQLLGPGPACQTR